MALTQKQLDEFANERVGDNFKILPDVLGELEREREQLALRLSGGRGVSDQSGSTEWEKVAADVQTTTRELKAVQSKVTTILCGHGKENGEEELTSAQSVKAASGIRHLVLELVEGDRLRKYLSWVRQVHQLSSIIENKLSVGSLNGAVEVFEQLCAISRELEGSRCVQLVSFVGHWCEQHRHQLKERLTSIFSDLLKAMGWPLVGTISSSAIAAQDYKKGEFMSCFKQLLALEQFPGAADRAVPALGDSLLLPLELMLAPLRKRFRFHFYGNVKTNLPDKPEWFFTQVSNWITSHTHFLESHVQPALDNTVFKHVDTKSEFIRGLLQEVDKRLCHSISLPGGSLSNERPLIDDDYLMSHLVDELLLFEQELRNVHCYPPLLPSCMEGLLSEAPLCRWLNLEKQFAVEKLKSIIDSPTAWQPRYAAVLEENETRVPECAENLMNLIAGITERYRLVPMLFPRLRFLELQSDMLLEFHQDLTSTVTSLATPPVSQRFIAYLNASHFITTVLQGWGEQTFFLELNYYSQHIHTSSSSSYPALTQQLEALRKIDPEFAELEGTAFDSVIAGFTSLTTDMLSMVTTHIITTLQTTLKPYQANKWHNISTVKDPLLEVSSSLLRFLDALQEQLLFLSSHLSLLLFPRLLSELCVLIDDIIFSMVVLPNHFNVGGASQLTFDLSKAIVPMLDQHTDIDYKAILRRSLDAAHLLQQLSGSLELLNSYLKSALSGDEEAGELAASTLQDMTVSSLTLNEAYTIVKLKVNS